jgi:C4-dicarboxylate-specific signal transduction histidine kinase
MFATISIILAVSFLHLVFITRITSLLKDIRKEELANKELEKKLISRKMELESKIDLSKIERRARNELRMEITQDIEYIKLK